MNTLTNYALIALGIIIIALGVTVKILSANNGQLKAEKAAIAQELSLTQADLKTSVANSNRMMSEKNRLIVAQREQAEVEQSSAVASAQIQKDIEYAADGTKCRDSDPMQRVLRGLFNAENHSGAKAIDRVPEPRRPGTSTGVPTAPASSKP